MDITILLINDQLIKRSILQNLLNCNHLWIRPNYQCQQSMINMVSKVFLIISSALVYGLIYKIITYIRKNRRHNIIIVIKI